MTNSPSPTQDVIVEFLRESCGLGPDAYERTTPLFSSGLLDSFALVAMLSFAEERFGIRLVLPELSQDTVDTVIAFAAYVDSVRARQA